MVRQRRRGMEKRMVPLGASTLLNRARPIVGVCSMYARDSMSASLNVIGEVDCCCVAVAES